MLPLRSISPAFCTDYSLCNALGLGRVEVLARLNAGATGLKKAPADFAFETFVGQVDGALPPLPSLYATYESRLGRMAFLLATELAPSVGSAIKRWGTGRVAIVLASSTGGLAETELAHQAVLRHEPLPANYSLSRTHSLAAAAELLQARFALTGPAFVISTACSSSAKALASAHRLLHAGMVDAVIAGGIDTLCSLTLAGFHSLGILSQNMCKPFAADRSGINIGEGGALVLLEREGKGPALLGSGETSDAHHMSAPDPTGVGAEQAMRLALQQAGVANDAVGYVNAHGTGTPLNDAAEATAIARVFGTRPIVASTKGFTGHMLGAAGATEAAFCVAALERQEIPTSLGSLPAQPDLNIMLAPKPTALASPFVMSNSFAFGGSNISLLFGNPNA